LNKLLYKIRLEKIIPTWFAGMDFYRNIAGYPAAKRFIAEK